MKLTEFAHGLAERYAPMSEKSSLDLQQKAANDYNNILNSVIEKQKITAANLSIKEAIDSPLVSDSEKTVLLEKLQAEPKFTIAEKVVSLSETTWFRYLLSAAFVWIQPRIQAYLNPAPPVQEEYRED